MPYLTKKGLGRELENLLLEYQKPKFKGKLHKMGDTNSTYYRNKCMFQNFRQMVINVTSRAYIYYINIYIYIKCSLYIKYADF